MPTSDPGDDAGARMDEAWAAFEARLAHSLKRLPTSAYLVIELMDGPAPGGASYFVQFACQRGAFLAEATGNHYLAPAQQLGVRQSAALADLGWQEPEDHPQRWNWHRRWAKPVSFETVAAFAVRTLREVHGAVSPDRLQYDRFRRCGGAIPDPSLGLPVIPGSTTATALARPVVTEERPKATKTQVAQRNRRDKARLHAIHSVLRHLPGVGDVEEMKPAHDGGSGTLSFLFQGHAMYAKAVHDPRPMTRVFTSALDEVTEDLSLLRLLNETNVAIATGRVLVLDGTVYVAFEVDGAPPDPEAVAWACESAVALAHHLIREVDNARNTLAAAAAGGLVN